MRVGRAEDHVIDSPFGLGFGNHLRGRKDERIDRHNRQHEFLVFQHEHSGIKRIAQGQRLAQDIDRTVRGRSDLHLCRAC